MAASTSPDDATEILLITGPAGIGKSTLCWELGLQLAAAEVRHAVIETDELDRVFPRPTAEELARLLPGATDMSALTLAAIWPIYRALGHRRLIMSGVVLHIDFDRDWIQTAIPGARVIVVRLQASERTLIDRLDKREIGSGRNAQLERTLRQARRLASEKDHGFILAPTDGQTPTEIAAALLRRIGWLPADQ